MAVEEITITQYSDNITKCLVHDPDAIPPADWIDNSAEAISIGGTPFTLWTDNNDEVYVGKGSEFAYVGFRVGTPAVGYGAFTAVYSDGIDGAGAVNSWTALTFIANNTANFTQSGFFAFAAPDDWVAGSVNGVGAPPNPIYWIRITQATVAPATPATAYHLLRNLSLGLPLHVEGPVFEIDRYYRDINGVMRLRDMTYNGPTRYTVGMTQIACTNLNKQLLYDWQYYKHNLYIQDEAFVGTGTNDCYYHTMTGRLIEVPPQMQSPYKMGLELNAYYPLVFQIDSVLTLSTALGLSA